MKKNGVTENKIKISYKIAIGLNIYVVIISIINLFWNMYWEHRDVFFGSIYLLLVPYFKFFKTQNYFEIIPAVILLAITVFLLYKSTKNYYNAKNCKPIFVSIFPMWIMISTLFAPAFFIDVYPYGFDNPPSNIVFYIIYAIYQAVISVMAVDEYYIRNQIVYTLFAKRTDDIFKCKYIISIFSFSYILVVLIVEYTRDFETLVILMVECSALILLLFFIYMIGYYINYKYIVRSNPEQKWDKTTKISFIAWQVIPTIIFCIILALILIL